MLVGLFLADVFVGLVAVYTSAVAVLVAAYSGQDKALVQVMLFNFKVGKVANVDVDGDLDVDIAAYSCEALLKVMLMLR